MMKLALHDIDCGTGTIHIDRLKRQASMDKPMFKALFDKLTAWKENGGITFNRTRKWRSRGLVTIKDERQWMMVWGVLHHRNETHSNYLGSMKPFSEGEPGSLGKKHIDEIDLSRILPMMDSFNTCTEYKILVRFHRIKTLPIGSMYGTFIYLHPGRPRLLKK